MKFRLLAILLFCSLISIAQEKDEDLDLQKNQILIQHDDTTKVHKLIKIGTKYFSVNYDTALVLLEKAHQISLKLGYIKGEIRAKQKIGNAYYLQNNFLKAEGFFKEAEEISIENDFKKLIAIGFRSKASLLHERGRFEEGVLFLKKALFIHQEMDDSTNIASVLNRISVFYRESKDIDSALFYNNQAIAASIVLNNKKLIGRSYRNLAIIYTITNELNKAESFFIKALDLQSIHSREKELLFTKYQYGILLLKQKKYDLAIDILNTCKEKTIEIGILKQLPHIYEKLSLAYSGNRQYKEAYQSAIEFHNLSEILRYEEENQREMEEKEREMEEKEREMEETRNKIISEREKATILEEKILKEKANQIKQTILIIALIIALIISVFLSRISKKKSIETTLLKQKTIAAKEIIDQYEKIDEWIAQELHDNIGGSIAAIRLQMLETLDVIKEQEKEIRKQDKEIFEMDLNKLNHLVETRSEEIEHLNEVYKNIRNLSHNLAPVSFIGGKFVSLLQEKISSIFPKSIRHSIVIEPEEELIQITDDLKFNVYRILQNLASNIVCHSKAKNSKIKVLGGENHLTILVKDEGIGFDPKTNHGLGLDLVQKRVLLFDGTIDIDSQINKGTTISITIPYPKNRIIE
jgi:signal transduction histidine kinase